MSYSLIIFDLDGTLVDTRLDLAAAVNAMRRHYNLAELPLETVIGYVGDGAAKLVERALADTGIVVEQGLEIMLDYYRRHICVHSELYPGCLDSLKSLQAQGIKMAVLTNKPLEMTSELLQQLGIAEFFSPILSPENAGCHKPEPKGVFTCLEQNGMAASQALMVGDHHTDLCVAQNAEIDAAFFTSGMGRQDDAPCKFKFASYSDFMSILAGNNN